MRISQINYTSANFYRKNCDNSMKDIQTRSNPSFGATFWKTVTKATSAGAAAGAYTGSQIGGTVDLGTAGATMGLATVTSTTAGGVIGGVTGFIGGTIKYYADKKLEREKAALEKERKELEDSKRKIKEKEEALEKEKAEATAKQLAAIGEKDKKLKEQEKQIEILGRFNTKKRNEINGVGLGKIAGYEDDKNALFQAFINPYRESYNNHDFDDDVPNAILLYGLSGNGKTTLSKAIVEELINTTKSNYYDLSETAPTKLPDKLIEIKEKALTDFDKNHKRTLIFLDEFDRFALREDMNGYRGDVNGHLKTFLNDCSQYGITVIATTNHPRNIEYPLITNKRRFGVKTVIEPPNKDDIKKIMEYYLKGLTTGKIDYSSIANIIDVKANEKEGKYSCSEIENLANKIKLKAKKEKQLITQNDIFEVINKSSPDINKKLIDKFKYDFEFMSEGQTYEEYCQERDRKV